MTYVPPERNGGGDDEPRDQTQQFATVPRPLRPEAQPASTFAADYAEPEATGADARPRRDRIVFQLIWETILLLLALNALFMVYRRREAIFGDEFGTALDAADAHLLSMSPLLLGVLALGLSLRLGAVNLAAPAAVFVAAFAPPLSANPWINLAWIAAGAAVAALLFSLLVLALRVPPWFAGLASAWLIWAGSPLLDRFSADLEQVRTLQSPGGLWIFLGVAALAVGGGLVGLLPSVRDGFSGVKAMADGTTGRGASPALLLVGGTFLSMLLAGGAGFMMSVFDLRSPDTESSLYFGVYSFDGQTAIGFEVFMFIAVLAAGTSLWGRRGGVLGSVLTTVLLWSGLLLWGELRAPTNDESLYTDWSQILFVGLLLVALFVSFGLDRLGRPREDGEAGDAEDSAEESSPFTPNPPRLFDPNAEPSTTPR
ncbi:hypothetical protein L0U85_01190 [Glycomyces sp. L485]|uniref:hypothetical protein n=1 Tax=Glycomyces sp. L485 TaxID=2909235 RepID=UPI001F4BC18D|nr:hypothetical protein [Glycomyces sp. L485]MCH7229482.1 hypothetical protein [Glycomyces sp. L485]